MQANAKETFYLTSMHKKKYIMMSIIHSMSTSMYVCVGLTNCAAFFQYQLYRALPVLHPEVEHPGLALNNVSGGGVDGAKS